MKSKSIATLIVAAALAATGAVGTSVVSAPAANASTRYCGDGRMGNWFNIQYHHLGITRHCQWNPSGGRWVSAYADVNRRRIEMFVGYQASSYAIDMQTLHEASHVAEYRMTYWDRQRVYRALGYKVGASYNSIRTYTHSGRFASWPESAKYSWGRSPRERLADAVVYCTYGRGTNKYINPRPASGCGNFMYLWRGAVARAR